MATDDEKVLLDTFWLDWAKEIDPAFQEKGYPLTSYQFVYCRLRSEFASTSQPQTWTAEDRVEINRCMAVEQAEFDQHFANVATDRMDAFKKSHAN